jgi:hypothetical protein
MTDEDEVLASYNDGRTIRLAPVDGSGGRVVIELPMDAEKAAGVMRACHQLGFEFEHLVSDEVTSP